MKNFFRRVFVAVNAETAAADGDATAEHHIPNVHMPTGLCTVVLFKWGHMLHRENRRLSSLQLPVSTNCIFITFYSLFFLLIQFFFFTLQFRILKNILKLFYNKKNIF